MRQENRATKRLNAARSDHWEAGYYCAGSRYRARGVAKREAVRARRRAERFDLRHAWHTVCNAA